MLRQDLEVVVELGRRAFDEGRTSFLSRRTFGMIARDAGASLRSERIILDPPAVEFSPAASRAVGAMQEQLLNASRAQLMGYAGW